MKLENFQADSFLAEYWQQQPLFIAQALPDYSSPYSVDELAGFACEDEYNSRLITNPEPGNWQIEFGPFSESTLSSLPASGWSLLLQDLDKHHHVYNDLLGFFDFIPTWRIDDVMISLAPDGASVGPHFDNYDVFLLQLEGAKTWHINQHSFDKNDLVTDTDLSILNNFTSEQTYLATPGDILYLPPGVAHHGIADDFSVTCSIGFRAPTDIELLTAYVDEQVLCPTANFYRDTELSAQQKNNWLSSRHRQAIQEHMAHGLSHGAKFDEWIGNFLTQPKPDNADWIESELNISAASISQLKNNGHIRRRPCCRSLLQQQDAAYLLLHVHGNCFKLDAKYSELAEALASTRHIKTSSILRLTSDPMFASVLERLLNTGCYELEK